MKHLFSTILALLLTAATQAQELQLVLPTGHNDAVQSMAYSPGGTFLASGSFDNTVKIWDHATGKLIHSMAGHKLAIMGMAFGATDDVLVTASADRTAIVWDPTRGVKVRVLSGHEREIMDLAITPDGTVAATASLDESARLWNVATGEEIKTLKKHKGPVMAVAISPDGAQVASVGADENLFLWEASSGKKVGQLKGGYGKLEDVTYSPDGATLAVTTRSGKLLILDPATAEVKLELTDSKDRLRAVQFHPKQSWVAAGSKDGTVYLWDFATGKLVHTLTAHSGDVRTLAFDKDGAHLATGSQDESLKYWDTSTGEELASFVGHAKGVAYTLFHPEDNTLVSASYGQDIYQWDTRQLEKKATLGGYSFGVNSIGYSEDGTRMVMGSWDGLVRYWNAESGKILRSFEGIGGKVTSVVIDSEGRRIAAAGEDGRILIWNANTGEREFALDGHSDEVTRMALSDDDNLLASVSKDGKALVWDFNTGEMLHDLPGTSDELFAVAFRAMGDGLHHVAAGGRESFIRMWSLPEGKLINSLEKSSEGHITALTFCPWDDNEMASGSNDNQVQLWNLEKGKIQETYKGHTHTIHDLEYFNFNETDLFLLSSSHDHTVKMWSLGSDELVLTLEGHTDVIKDFAYTRYYADGLDDWRAVLTTSSWDGTLKTWDLPSGQLNSTIVSLDQGDNSYAIVSPTGLFDASERLMNEMYYVKGMEVIELEQFKDIYWEPGLMQRTWAGDKLRDVPPLDEVKLHPGMRGELGPSQEKLQLQIENRGGGVGKIELYVNGILKYRDLTALGLVEEGDLLKLEVPLTPLQRFMEPGQINTLTLVPHNEDGTLKGRGFEVPVLGNTGATTLPQFHALVIGTSDYRGDELDLSFAGKDAVDMANSVRLAASNLFQPENTHIHVLSTEEGYPEPTKENIRTTIEEIASESAAPDVLMVFMAGHGNAYGSEPSKEDFYYLTKDMSGPAISDPYIREQYTVSGSELIEWLNAVAANKRVMIMDACHSGQLGTAFANARGADDEAARVRSLERMHDYSGLYILAGSAADKVSYEASRFGQGLLTYSLLEFMKKEALRDGKFLDVAAWVNSATYRVPELAAGIGGIQKPQLSTPAGTGSFDVGLLSSEDRVKIKLQEAGVTFAQPDIENAETWEYDVELNDLVMAQLDGARSRGGDSDAIGTTLVRQPYVPGGVNIRGRYRMEGDTYVLQTRLLQEREMLAQSQFEGTSKEDLAKKLVDWALASVSNVP